MKILLVAPTEGNGGIVSWTRKYIKTFPSDEFELIHVGVSKRRSSAKVVGFFQRASDGFLDLLDVRKDVIKAIKENPDIRLFHTTTSGSIGTLRDYVLCRICHKHDIKTIMHCRYGCIPSDFVAKGFWGRLLRKTMHIYDNVWVLDTRSEKALLQDPLMRGKVHLTPNSIQVKDPYDDRPKAYNRMAFIGNLIPTKGLYEMVEAAARSNIRLDVIGPGEDDVVSHVKSIAGEALDKRIFVHGQLPNEEAVKFMHEVDIVGLPSYYPYEAFPISIIEAMSLSKLVISTDRAAIPDMLTALDGSRCGILVKERSVDDIVDAIDWCQTNSAKADILCQKAYEKVKTCYDTSVIYKLYGDLYTKLAEK